MIAMQTRVSAAVAVVLAGSSVIAVADPDDGDGPAADPADAPPGATEPTTEPAPRPPTGRFQVGIGMNPDDLFVTEATIAQDDLFRTGWQLSLSARLSRREQLVLARVADPTLLGSEVGLSLDVYNHRRQLPGLTREAVGGTFTLSRPLTTHLRGFIGYRLEEVSPEPGGALALRTTVAGAPLAAGTLSALTAGLAYDVVDATAWPMRGTRMGVMVEHADRRLGSDVELDRVKGWLSHHQPIGPFTLHLGFLGEAVTGPNIPRSERLYLDGSSDLRGYHPGAFAAQGGDLKLMGRGELEVPLIRAIGLSATGFVDVGGIWDRFGAGATGRSWGLGLLWHSPIGTLRFDWAFTPGSREPAFLFSLGSF